MVVPNSGRSRECDVSGATYSKPTVQTKLSWPCAISRVRLRISFGAAPYIFCPINRDPEGVTLGKNLDILATLLDVVARMENPTSGRDNKAKSHENVKTAAAEVHHLAWGGTSHDAEHGLLQINSVCYLKYPLVVSSFIEVVRANGPPVRGYGARGRFDRRHRPCFTLSTPCSCRQHNHTDLGAMPSSRFPSKQSDC